MNNESRKQVELSKQQKMLIRLEVLRNKGVINQETYEASKEDILRKK